MGVRARIIKVIQYPVILVGKGKGKSKGALQYDFCVDAEIVQNECVSSGLGSSTGKELSEYPRRTDIVRIGEVKAICE